MSKKYETRTAWELVTGWAPTEKHDRQKMIERKRLKNNWKKSKDERQK